jgi:hypothetical protein
LIFSGSQAERAMPPPTELTAGCHAIFIEPMIRHYCRIGRDFQLNRDRMRYNFAYVGCQPLPDAKRPANSRRDRLLG